MSPRLPPEEKARRAAVRASNRLSEEQKKRAARIRDRAYYAAHAERKREYAKAYRTANAAALRAARQARHEADPTRRQRRDAKYYRSVVAVNRESVNAKARAARQRDIDRRRLYGAFRAARRRALKAQAPGAGSITQAGWHETLQVFAGRCAYCLDAAQEADHLHPLALGGADAIENLVPACRRCNRSKGAKPLLLWMLAKRSRR
jgi:5-methylcytosine-specific restriction endonuclease McrA